MYLTDFIMPVSGAIFVLVIIVVLIVVLGKTYQTWVATVNRRSFEELANELRAENTYVKNELADVKETLKSIDRMLKEIDQ